MENLVLGGGLAGLIYAYYNKDFKVLTDKIGGQAASGFTLGPRIIQAHPATKRLLSDLGFESFVSEIAYDYEIHKRPVILKTARIGYYENGRILSEPSNDKFRVNYYIKSRCLNSSVAVPSSVMSDNKTAIDYYAISHERLANLVAEKLRQENRIFIARVDQVDLEENLLSVFADGKMKTMAFDRLVNTAPFPIFFKLCNPDMKLQEGSFEYEPKYFISADKHDFKNFISEDFDYIYYADDNPFHRITVGETEVTVECTGDKAYGMFHHIYEPLKWSSHCLKIGQIKESLNVMKLQRDGKDVDNVRNIGRYAQWDHEVKTQQCVELALKGLWQ